ncbi:MAG TPA: wax ester/triacylglycerol synthase family O-acyltransferase [Solirubrobacteraceae bacterium]|nr:wax ester/triacylglycerol synthase family O-acyltransferase [Solirubrobacteraceae bacterium]
MSAQDAAFLHIEQDSSPMHVGGVSIFEGPAPQFELLQSMIASKLAFVPRYRQLVRFVPFGVSRPVWVDDPHFNLGYHVRRTALPSPGGDDELRALVGRVMSQNLDRAKPLWEMWVVEGLEDGRWALLSKVHHCMVDGVAGTDLMAVMLDTERDASPPPPDDWTPAPAPSDASLLASAIADRLVNPFAAAESLAGALRAPRQFAGLLEQTAEGIVHSAGIASQPPPSSLNGPLGPHRRWDWARGRLSDVQQVRKALGGTVNDVVLAAITHGFRELLLSRGESADRVLRTLVPVSVRRPGERGTYNNRVSAMFAELPVAIEDPAARLRSITEQMAGLKDSKQAVAGEVLTSLSGFAPPMLLALGARVAARIPQRSLNTGTTNVPGPQFPLYAGGRRMLESFPYIPLFAHVRVAVAIFSYDGGLSFGISGDYDSAPDIDVLAAGIEAGLAQLVALAEPVSAAEMAPAPTPEPETT